MAADSGGGGPRGFSSNTPATAGSWTAECAASLVRIVPLAVRTFLVVWSGQLVSQIGTAMSTFALLIWIHERITAVAGTAMSLAGYLFRAVRDVESDGVPDPLLRLDTGKQAPPPHPG